MEIPASLVKELREKTGVGMMQCKKALAESGCDVAEAEKLLRKLGVAAAAKKADRATGEGQIGYYVHTGGKIGVLIEVNCETDFAARSDDFQDLVRGLAMHIAAAAPRYVRREEVGSAVLDEEREIARAQAAKSGKPPAVLDKIVDGKVEKFYAETVLLEQPYVKDPDKSVGQHVAEAVGRIGENIQVRRFARFVLGEST
jgi:elongation factor Ts